MTILVAATHPAQADRYWNPQGGSTDFNLDATGTFDSNWVTTGSGTTVGTTRGTAPTSTDGAFIISSGLTNPNLTASITLKFLEIDNYAYTLTADPGAVLTLTSTIPTAGPGTALRFANSAGTTINANIILGANTGDTQYFSSNTSGTLNGIISSTNSPNLAYVSGAATWTVNGANTYTGNTQIGTTAGRTINIILGNKSAFGTGTVFTVSPSGTTAMGLGAGINLTGANKVANNFLLGTDLILNNSGANGIELAGTVDMGGAARTLNSVISGGQHLIIRSAMTVAAGSP